MKKALPLLAAALFIGQVDAHGLWTEQRRGNIETIYGHGAEDNAFKAEKISGAWAYDSRAKMIPITLKRLDDHARLEPLKPPAMVAVALDNGPWSLTPDQQWINQGRSKVPSSTKSLHTFKYSLAIYQEGAKLPALDQLKMVIVPETDPLEVGVGKLLPVRVLIDGKPAAGIELIGDYRGAPHQVSAVTDAAGRAQVMVRNEGLNIIAAEANLPVANDPDIETRGLFTSLTFLGEAHSE
ncbi:Nickel uptake substrate-specific transmembrane region [compost metagenome]